MHVPLKIQEAEKSSTSEELAAGVGRIKISDDSPIFSPKTASTISSSGEGNCSSSSSVRPRDTFNIFLNQCQIQLLGRPWLDWGEVSVRTKQRYVQWTGEIVAAVLNVISPNNAPDLWKALQSFSVLNQQLGLHLASLPSEAAYLEALAEAYSNATSWDTRRQVLSMMTGVDSFRAISEFMTGLTECCYTVANLHRVQYGRNAPVPTRESPRLRINPKQLDHFLGFITSPHLV